MILIHTALLCEAQIIIEKYKLTKISSSPKVYRNNNILVLVGGVGKQNTIKSLKFIFENYEVRKAFNIGIAGCGNKKFEIGELFCTNKKLDNIKYKELKTVDFGIEICDDISSLNLDFLYDMEGEYFLLISQKYLQNENIYIFKIISDYLDDAIPSKDFVKKLIHQNIANMENWI